MNNLGNRSAHDVPADDPVELPARAPSTAQVSVEPPSGLKLKVFLILIAILWLAVVAFTWVGEDGAEASEAIGASRAPAAAAGTTTNSSANSSDDEYNFNWLDPEKKIYVLQNRRYTKAHRVLLSVMAGPGLSNPYRTTFNVDPRVAYYFTEEWGLEGFYTLTFNTPNSTVAALTQATPTTLAVVHEIRSEGGVLVHWAPWYAKINVFNKILYFDWYFSAGGGVVNWYPGGTGSSSAAGTISTAGLSRGALFGGTGQQFHITDSLTVRLDFTGAFFTAPIVGTSTSGDNTTWYSNYNFGLGLGISL